MQKLADIDSQFEYWYNTDSYVYNKQVHMPSVLAMRLTTVHVESINTFY